MGIVAGQAAGAVEEGEPPIGVAMHPHLDPHVVHAVAVGGDLQGHPLEGNTVVLAYLIRRLFQVAPAWVAYRRQALDAAAATPEMDGVAFDIKTAFPEGFDPDLRDYQLVLAIYQARRSCVERSSAALVDAEALLALAQAESLRKSAAGAADGGSKSPTERPEHHAAIVAMARDLLNKGAPRRGLAGRVARAMARNPTKFLYIPPEGHIPRLLRKKYPHPENNRTRNGGCVRFGSVVWVP